MNTEKHGHLIGSIVPAGYNSPQWMFVTKVAGDTIYGRKWSATSQTWTKGAAGYARDAIFRLTPRCPRPPLPTE